MSKLLHRPPQNRRIGHVVKEIYFSFFDGWSFSNQQAEVSLAFSCSWLTCASCSSYQWACWRSCLLSVLIFVNKKIPRSDKSSVTCSLMSELNESRCSADLELDPKRTRRSRPTLALAEYSGIPLCFLLLLVLFRLVLSCHERIPRVLSGSEVTWHQLLAAYHSLFDSASLQPALFLTLSLSSSLLICRWLFGPTIFRWYK